MRRTDRPVAACEGPIAPFPNLSRTPPPPSPTTHLVSPLPLARDLSLALAQRVKKELLSLRPLLQDRACVRLDLLQFSIFKLEQLWELGSEGPEECEILVQLGSADVGSAVARLSRRGGDWCG